MRFGDLLALVRKRPEMYGLDGRYASTVAFVNGCDAGSEGLLLTGFNEWLQVRAGKVSNLAWSAQVADLAGDDTDAARIETMFALLAEFLADRSGRGGPAELYFRYFELLRREGLYEFVTAQWRQSPPPGG